MNGVLDISGSFVLSHTKNPFIAYSVVSKGTVCARAMSELLLDTHTLSLSELESNIKLQHKVNTFVIFGLYSHCVV